MQRKLPKYCRGFTVNAALVAYYQHSSFTDALAKVTQQNRRAILEQLRNDHGDKRISLMDAKALQAIMNHKTPSSQRPSATSSGRGVTRPSYPDARRMDCATHRPSVMHSTGRRPSS